MCASVNQLSQSLSPDSTKFGCGLVATDQTHNEPRGSPNEIPPPSTYLSLCARSDHLPGSHCHLRCWTANTRYAPHWSRSLGLGRWSLYPLVRHIRNPDGQNGRSSRCAASTDPHRAVVVRLYCTHWSHLELLCSPVGSLLLWSWRGRRPSKYWCKSRSLVSC